MRGAVTLTDKVVVTYEATCDQCRTTLEFRDLREARQYAAQHPVVVHGAATLEAGSQ